MKRKIIVSIILLIITSMLLLIIPKNKEDILYAVTIDGKKVNSFPEHGNYNVNVKCDNATGTWNYTKWMVDVTEIIGDYICEVAFTTSNKQNLNDYIMNLVGTTRGDGEVVHEELDYTIPTTENYRLSQSQYGNVSQYYSTSRFSTSDTSVTNAFSYSNNVWTSNPSNLTSSKFYHIKFTVPENGFYQLCYTLSSGNVNNSINIYNGTKQIDYFNVSSSDSKSGCIDIGKITTSDSLRVVQYAYTSIATITFYLNKMNTSTTNYNVGYRYEGSNPNNYILFNDELWRIIGVFDQTTHGVNSNLVKIIRNNDIGSLVYDTSGGEINSWGESTLYKLLNQETGGSYYTGIYYINRSDGTYCSSYEETAPVDCSYSNTGIKSDYTRGMIEKTNWYSTPYSSETASETYLKDIITTTSTEGYIGLMYLSDYGYAVKASDCARTISLDSYGGSTNGLTCAGKNWLYNGQDEWTLSRFDVGTDYSFYVTNFGNNEIGRVGGAIGVRPTLYLKSDVYYVGGTGSYDDPIIIGY